MSRQDARERTVDAAVARLNRTGVTVALDGISLEEAIADSGVSRATAYRRWPNRSEFVREVLVQTVRGVRLEPETDADLEAIRAVLADLGQDLDTVGGRRTAVVESLRVATEADHRRLSTSRQWQDFLALRITCEGLPDEALRHTLTEELRAAEHTFTRQRAGIYARIPDALGYRLTIPLPEEDGLALMARAMGALMTGLILHRNPDQKARTFRAKAFGSTIESRWSTPGYALTAMFLGYLEPDPQARPGPLRLADLLTPDAGGH